jgi:hypothetical protein
MAVSLAHFFGWYSVELRNPDLDDLRAVADEEVQRRCRLDNAAHVGGG